MVHAAIDPETGEFLGLIVPAKDLDGDIISIHGSAEDWAAATRGEPVPKGKIGVTHFRGAANMTVSIGRVTPDEGKDEEIPS